MTILLTCEMGYLIITPNKNDCIRDRTEFLARSLFILIQNPGRVYTGFLMGLGVILLDNLYCLNLRHLNNMYVLKSAHKAIVIPNL